MTDTKSTQSAFSLKNRIELVLLVLALWWLISSVWGFIALEVNPTYSYLNQQEVAQGVDLTAKFVGDLMGMVLFPSLIVFAFAIDIWRDRRKVRKSTP